MEFNTVLSIIIIVVIVIIIVVFGVLLGVFNKTNTSQDETITKNKKLIEENKEAIEAVKKLAEENHKVVYMYDTKAMLNMAIVTAKSGERTFDIEKLYDIPVTIYGYHDTETGEAVISTKQFLLDISDVKGESDLGRTLCFFGIKTEKYQSYLKPDYSKVTTEVFDKKDDMIVGGTFKFAIPTKEITTHHTVYKFSDIKEGLMVPFEKVTKDINGKSTWHKGYDLFVKNASVNNNVLSYAVNTIGLNNKASVISIALFNVALIDAYHYNNKYDKSEDNNESTD